MNPYWHNRGVMSGVRGIAQEQMPNFANLFAPAQALMPTLVEGYGGKLQPGIGYQQTMDAMPEQMRRYNQSQQSAANMMSGDDGEEARRLIAARLQQLGRGY